MRSTQPGITKSISKDMGASDSSLSCPLCGKLFKKSLALSLEAHVFHCLDKKEQLNAKKQGIATEKEKEILLRKDSNSFDSSDSVQNRFRAIPGENGRTQSLKENNLEIMKKADEIERIPKKPRTEKQTQRHENLERDQTLMKEKKPCPFYKLILPTSFSMDAFSFGPIEGCTAYFLSHFHSDHYMGLSGKFDYGPIYCSPITGALIKSQLNVKSDFIHVLALNEVHLIQGVSVRLLDANHCPGAAIFLFEIPIPSRKEPLAFIHTGDFRADPFHWTHPILLSKKWDRVYLDTTYCKEIHTFPVQKQVLDVVAEVAERIDKGESLPDIINPNNLIKHYFTLALNSVKKKKTYTLFVVGSYLIGKEKVFLSIASRIQTKVYTDKRKMKVYEIVANHDTNLASFLTSNKREALVHVVPMNQINHDDLLEMKKSMDGIDQIIAFRPTGWTFTSSSKIPPPQSHHFNVKMLKPVYLDDNITVIPLPYSEHSSYTELQMFCQNLEINEILPTVNLSPKSRAEMTKIFSKWKKQQIKQK